MDENISHLRSLKVVKSGVNFMLILSECFFPSIVLVQTH